MVFVSPEEVQNATGASVSFADVTSAQFVIETISGVMLQVPYDTASAVDLDWIRRAVIFQAVWAADQPDFQSRLNATSISQDGVSVSAADGLTFVLAPLAKRALSNCSWAKSGTLRVAPALAGPALTDPTISDAHGGWVTL